MSTLELDIDLQVAKLYNKEQNMKNYKKLQHSQ